MLFLAPFRQLVWQTRDRLEAVGLSVGVWHGRRKPNPTDQVHTACVFTAANRELPWSEYDLVVADEAHRAPSEIFRRLLQKSSCRKLGLTATPIRLDGRPLSTAFDELVVGVTTKQLVDQGFLTPIRAFAREEGLDLKGVKVDRKTRDYDRGQLAKRMRKPKLVGDAVDEWFRHAHGRPTIAFATTVAHAEAIRDDFQGRSIAAEVITAHTSDKKRADLFEAVKAGQLKVLCNVGCLAEGFDLPIISCVLLARPTLSLGFHLQTIGRGLRTAAGKTDCIVLDHADNLRKHGFPTDECQWSLSPKREDNPLDKPHSQPEAQTKKCPACNALVPLSCSMCECGHIWLPGVVDARLERLHPHAVARSRDF